MQMCHSFTRLGLNVILLGFKGERYDEAHAYYGTANFELGLSDKPLPVIGLWLQALNAVRTAKAGRPDYIFGRSLFSAFLLARSGFKVVLETHDPFSTMDGLRKKVFRSLLQSSNLLGLVVMSDALKKIIQAELPFYSSDKILAVHDGSFVHQINEKQVEGYPWPAPGADRPQIGYVGTISAGRGVELIVKCAEKIREADFHIIGGQKQDLSKLNGLHTAAPPENLFFHGFVSPASAAVARRKCHILLAPYQKDLTIKSGKATSSYMSPLKIFEYMESGRAIIASDLPVLREVLVDKQNSYLVPPDDAGAWMGAINTLIADTHQRNALAEQARKDLYTKYTWDIRAQKILEFIKKRQNI